MPKVRILPEHVANQIAAGEVIERPAAVVKELLENSLDAGATQIEIAFKNGGKSYIRIQDNGCGMTPDDALLALERHATSKIKTADDLMTVGTLGFRGEAVPSIASVSKFCLKTRSGERPHGMELLINAGKMIHQKDCGMPVGTTIEVSHLFNSVPVRRKFLKTDNTEAAHIIQLARLYALSYPHISFTLIENQKTLFQTPACNNLKERITEVWGDVLANDLIEVKKESFVGVVSGYISKPGVTRSSRQEVITIVNGRPVDSRALYSGINESYQGYIPKGRYPVAFLKIQVDSNSVDVNVHPAKREVRFKEEQRLRTLVVDVLSEALSQESKQAIILHEIPESTRELSSILQLNEPALAITINRPKHQSPQVSDSVFSQVPLGKIRSAPVDVAEPIIDERKECKLALDWKFLAKTGQYIALFETPRGLLMMHCRAAHERIVYERLLKAFEADELVASQSLLVPITFDLPPVDASLFEECLADLQVGGFHIEAFGRNTFRATSLPVWMDPAKTELFVSSLLESFADNKKTGRQVLHEKIAKKASQQAFRRDDTLSSIQIQKLAEELMACRQPLTTPSGKATFFELSEGELNKRFGRK